MRRAGITAAESKSSGKAAGGGFWSADHVLTARRNGRSAPAKDRPRSQGPTAATRRCRAAPIRERAAASRSMAPGLGSHATTPGQAVTARKGAAMPRPNAANTSTMSSGRRANAKPIAVPTNGAERDAASRVAKSAHHEGVGQPAGAAHRPHGVEDPARQRDREPAPEARGKQRRHQRHAGEKPRLLEL